jgi:hypothetical protein
MTRRPTIDDYDDTDDEDGIRDGERREDSDLKPRVKDADAALRGGAGDEGPEFPPPPAEREAAERAERGHAGEGGE